MSTLAKVQEWLRNNNGNLTDAYKAVNYEGTPLKIKDGNLNDKRSKIRLSPRGENGDHKRSEATKLRPPTSKDEQNQNRRQNYKRRSLQNKLGIPFAIDHVIDLGLLYETVKDLLPEDQEKHIKQLEKSYGPLGNRPGNRKVITSKKNGIKNAQTQAVQRRLGEMEKSNPSAGTGGTPSVFGSYNGATRINANPLATGETFAIP